MQKPTQQVPPQPSPPDQSVSFEAFDGLNNIFEPEHLGPRDLVYGINIDLDDKGHPHRRRGYTKLDSGNYSNLFESMDSTVYCIKDGALCRLRRDFVPVSLATGFPIPCPRMAWQQVGPWIYFSSRAFSGKVNRSNDHMAAWGAPQPLWFSPVVDPTPTLPPIRGRLYKAPPLCEFMAYFNGRIYMGRGRQVWYTELYLYDWIDATKNFWTFEADITLIGAVADGIYVGTEEGVWFLSMKWQWEARAISATRTRVLDFGAIPGSMVYIPAELANPPQVDVRADTPVKVSIAFLTKEGYCGGQDGGLVYNYTENKFVFPDSVGAASLFRRQQGLNQFVTVLDSGGQPVSNARIGDYADAVLLQNAAWTTTKECVGLGDALEMTYIPA
jgi:hypothetical protein